MQQFPNDTLNTDQTTQCIPVLPQQGTTTTNDALAPIDHEYFHELVDANDWKRIREFIIDCNPVDAAKLLNEVDEKYKLLVIFKLLSKDQAAAIFTYLDGELHRYIIESVTNADLSELLKRLFVDDAVDLLEELPSNMVRMILAAAPPDKRRIINQALSYPENSAGSLMTIEFVSLFENMTVETALAHIRKTGTKKETIYYCYVTDPSRKLVGVISLRSILLADNDKLIGDIMTTPVKHVHTRDDQEAVARYFQDYDLTAMPVVDNEDRIVGIITIDDIVDVIEAENTEDFEKMAALKPSEDEYLKTSILRLARNRIVWLLVLMISATATGAVIGHYQHLLASAAFLAAFIPMLMDTGGNCGSQASTLIIRGMAVGDIQLTNWLSVVWRELRVACIVGLALATVNFLRMHFFNTTLNYGDVPKLKVELIVTGTLFFTIIFAKITGCILPMTAKKIGFDPALMASPMLTTIVDAFALLLFFSVAGAFIAN